MKIKKAESFILHVPITPPITDAINVATHWGLAGVRIYTDEGITGCGYTGTCARGDEVTRVAGITEWLQVAGLASAYDLPICPHVGDMGQIHQHLVAATQNAVMLEYIPWIRHIFVEPITVRDGYYVLPQRPGASTDILPELFERYRVK
jgi:L-alanine-DL-glutamate epimerase-like enolase superfamily enzyme